MSAKGTQQSMILTYQICVLNTCSLQGVTWLSTSLYQQTFRKINMITDQIIHTLQKWDCMLVYVII